MSDDTRPLTVGSLFSGVGGFDLGFQWAGYDHRFFAEIDLYCRAVLAARFPGVPVYEDVKDVDASAGYVDVLIGGFPCQDLSVAGKRAGLAGERSGLFHEFMRIVDALHPRAVVLENVEGLYSSGSPKGADFGIVLDTLAELGYVVAWRTLDAQHFGVPQRRRRVFLCAIAESDPAAGCGPEVLAVTESCERHPQTSDPSWPLATGGTGDGASGSGVVGAITGRNVTRLDDQCVGGGHLVPAVTRKWAKGSGGPAGDEHQNLVWSARSPHADTPSTPIRSSSAAGSSSPAATSQREREERRERRDEDHPVRRGRFDRSGGPSHRGAWKGVGVNPSNEEVAGTLPSNQQGGQRTTDIAGAYVYRKSKRAQSNTDDETWVDGDVANTLNQFDVGDSRTTHAVVASSVRRLTPLECERLMGWPDNHTDVPWNKKEHSPDSRRYAACGNGVVAPVAYWIAARLAEVLR